MPGSAIMSLWRMTGERPFSLPAYFLFSALTKPFTHSYPQSADLRMLIRFGLAKSPNSGLLVLKLAALERGLHGYRAYCTTF